MINQVGDTALMKAAERAHVDVVKLLLAYPGINVNATREVWQCYRLVKMLTLLLILCWVPLFCVQMGTTALMRAAHDGATEAARLLLEHPKIDVNVKTPAVRLIVSC